MQIYINIDILLYIFVYTKYHTLNTNTIYVFTERILVNCNGCIKKYIGFIKWFWEKLNIIYNVGHIWVNKLIVMLILTFNLGNLLSWHIFGYINF